MNTITNDQKIELLKLSTTIGTYTSDCQINTIDVTLENFNKLVAAISN